MSKSNFITVGEINNIRRHGFEQGYLTAILGKDYIWEASAEDCKEIVKKAEEILEYQDKKLENYLKQ